jgi:hypothetical protein
MDGFFKSIAGSSFPMKALEAPSYISDLREASESIKQLVKSQEPVKAPAAATGSETTATAVPESTQEEAKGGPEPVVEPTQPTSSE